MRKICFLTFNFPRDYALAAALHAPLYERFRDVADFVWCVESKHESVPVPEGVKVLVRDFNRGGNLRYTEALHAMTAIFAELAEEYSVIVKLDADTFLQVPEIWTDYILDGGDVAYIPHLQNRAAGNGCCYALSARAAKFFAGISPEQFDATAFAVHGREDMFFTSLVTGNSEFYAAMIPRNRVSWCDIGTQPGGNAVAAHLGYLSDADIALRIASITGAYFTPANASGYAKHVAQFCTENKIDFPERKALFGLDGEKLAPVNAQTKSYQGVKIS